MGLKKNSKSALAVALSGLDTFKSPKISMEQFPTDSEIAAEVLWHAVMNDDIEDKTIADLGCGTGVLGIGAILLNAKKVYFVDTDKAAIKVLETNLERMDIQEGFETIHADIENFDKTVDVVIQNPPFGTREKHADKEFLEKAFKIAPTVYSFHKTSTVGFIQDIADKNGFLIEARWDFRFPLKQTQSHHKKKIHRIDVSCFKLVKA